MRRVNQHRILILGATGFIGNSLITYFSKNNYTLLGITRKDINFSIFNIKYTKYNAANIRRIINEFKPTVIINAAGSASVENSFINPQQDFNNSVILVNILLEGIRQSLFKPLFVQISSASVYKTDKNLPIKENTTLFPISPYGYHKMLCDLIAKEYYYSFDIPVLIIRLFSIFGLNQRRLLLWEIFNKFTNKNFKSVVINGTGEESRDYLYIDDFSYLLSLVLNEVNRSYMVLNIASGKSYKVKDIASLMKKNLKSNKPLIFEGYPQTGKPKNWQADISKMKKLMNITNLDFNFEIRLKKCIKTWSQEI